MTCLIVANQTLGGPELQLEVTQRIEQGRDRFHVVVPVTRPGLEHDRRVVWNPSFAIPDRGSRDDALEEANRRAEHRLEQMIALVEEHGGTATGEVGTTNALNSVTTCFLRDDYDEVLVSTLPAGISRWLKVDLPTRIGQVVDVPVTTVEAAG
ncbi:hypothetical protein [Salsipaludibacter albus]|uniref:hypothetical protein n=1 Tax=Salsipaludibacter albus TaxID=2849650 RepID=UPI001EE4E38F|nr:hypothetical protein [Salsipaludibacter albus]MBY5162342.1 hypothetical protein [Salsipaludibacter albus]